MENISKDKYDVIIAGSGLGALTSAFFLSKVYKKKVLILEKHFVIGGQSHEFKRRGKYAWDVGLHYVGALENWRAERLFFDYITENNLKWKKFNELFDVFSYPDFKIKVSSKPKRYIKELIRNFPKEKKNIKEYFKDLNRASIWYKIHHLSNIFPKFVQNILSFIKKSYEKLAFMTVDEYMNSHFTDDKLKGILGSRWLAYLSPPREASFAMDSVIAEHYLRGGYYPVGGASNIAKTITPAIIKNGGKLLTNSEVTEIIVKDNEAIGVKVTRKENKEYINEEYYAPLIISSVGAYNTYTKLLPNYNNPQLLEKIKNLTDLKSSVLILYLGLKDSPTTIGLDGCNFLFFDEYDHNKIYDKSYEIINGKPNHCFISFSSMRKEENAKFHTAEIIYSIQTEPFDQWKGQKWRNRDDSYYELKEVIANKLLDYVDKKIPGFKDLVDYKDLSTPLTIEDLVNWEYGKYTGLTPSVDRYKEEWLRADTPIKNLYLTGCDINSTGIAGGMMGGIITVSKIMGKFCFNMLFTKSLINKLMSPITSLFKKKK